MNKKYAPTFIIVILLIVFAMFWLYAPGFYGFLTLQERSFFEEGDFEDGGGTIPLPPTPPLPGAMHDIDTNTLIAFRSFDDDNIRISGVINKPTPCHNLTYDIGVSVSEPPQAEIAFKLEDTTTSESACAQVVTEESFDILLNASANAGIGATLNGIPLTLLFLDGMMESAGANDLGTQIVE
jgi:hypothetical protein